MAAARASNRAAGRAARSAVASSSGQRRRLGLAAVVLQLAVCIDSGVRVEARDFLSNLVHIKLPGRLLEEGKALGRTVQAAAQRPEEAVRSVRPGDLGRVTGQLGGAVSDLQRTLSNKELQEALRESPKLAEAIRRTDPERVIKALEAADPKEIEDIFQALDTLEYWRRHWHEVALALLAGLSGAVLLARWLCRRRRRGKRAGVALEHSEQGLLELEEIEVPQTAMFIRAPSPASL